MSLNRVVLGTAQFGLDYGVANSLGKIESEESKKIIKLSRHEGITFLDTAIAYGNSEENLGKIGVTDYKIISKLTSIPKEIDDIESWIVNQTKESLSRLKLKKLYGMLLHRPDDLLSKNSEDIYRGLQKIKNLGYVEKIGISIYEPEILYSLLEKFDLDIVQAPLNIVEQRILSNNYHKKLKEKNIELHVRSVFMQGLLLMSKDKRPEYFTKWQNKWDIWHSWLSKNKINSLEACLAFPLSFPEVDKVIVGSDNEAHLKEIINCLKKESIFDYPQIKSNDINLINPSNWNLK